ncbi:hypothetical protein ES332_A08G100900v1 [Gossypium tomentosum]|uniref:Auxin-responsive protein n=1 Tax=Gossypium tomentosum TaxID=34277 RepID=A0A5D2PCI0_GOSTO|nr:hypothetical protein ES332_A08G100900v1 [Gossypium tomentosum]
MPSSDRPTRERKVVERYSAPSVARSSSSKNLSIEKLVKEAILPRIHGLALKTTVVAGNWTWEHAKPKARMETLQRNLRINLWLNQFLSFRKRTKHCKNRITITRKIDIKLYHSYQSLTISLITMFSKDKKCDEDDYILTYQDKEGEWLIAGDIPWQLRSE